MCVHYGYVECVCPNYRCGRGRWTRTGGGGKVKKCNGPDMESRKGWFTLFPVAPSFSVKFFFPCLLRGVELGQPEKRNDAVPRFSRYERTYTASDHGRRIMVHRKSIRKEDESPLGVRRVKSLNSYRWQLQFPLSLRRYVAMRRLRSTESPFP